MIAKHKCGRMRWEETEMEKMPPIEKIYEAYTAIVDRRVEMSENLASIASSDGKKHYTVSWDRDVYRSDDSATYWQGYPGYPVIAVLMLEGRLPYDKETAELFSDVNWNALNKKYKRDYAAAAREVMKERNMDVSAIEEKAQAVYEELKKLPIELKRGKSAS